jgi:hypothetical protein
MKFFETLEPGQNVGWCKPYLISTEDFDACITVTEGEITGILVGDDEWPLLGKKGLYPCYSEAQLLKLAHLIYGEESDLTWNIQADIMDSAVEIGCLECPWKNMCEVMEEEPEE